MRACVHLLEGFLVVVDEAEADGSGEDSWVHTDVQLSSLSRLTSLCRGLGDHLFLRPVLLPARHCCGKRDAANAELRQAALEHQVMSEFVTVLYTSSGVATVRKSKSSLLKTENYQKLPMLRAYYRRLLLLKTKNHQRFPIAENKELLTLRVC